MKEDLTLSRFAMPKAAIAFDKAGRPVYGLMDVPARRQLGHQFEQAKTTHNTEAEEKFLRPQSGQRSAARDIMLTEWARREQEAQRRPNRHFIDLSLRTSSGNPLAGTVVTHAKPEAQRTSLRTYSDAELPVSMRTHVMPYMAPITACAEQEQQVAKEEATRRQALFQKVMEAKQLARRTCEEYPHGLTKLALAKLRSDKGGLVQMADLPALSMEYTSTAPAPSAWS